MVTIRFEENRLFRDERQLTVWSSGREDAGHYYHIVMAASSANERYILSMDKEGCFALWDGHQQKTKVRALKEFKPSDVRAIAVPDSAKVIFVATDHEVHMLQMCQGWHGDYGSLTRVCGFPITVTIASLQWSPEGLEACDADQNKEVIRVKV